MRIEADEGVKAPARASRYLFASSVGALGVVYGDIGTSPLYALRESFLAAKSLSVTEENVLGVLSLIFWALILVVSVKYLVFVMRADNHGEGGIMALTSLLVPDRTPVRTLLVGIGLFGTALLYGDGMITPAISVLSAVEGLELAAPSVEPYVVFIASAILVVLFSIQRRGTAAIGAVFGPIMVVWFLVLSVLGAVQIFEHPRVLAAVNPLRGVSFVGANPRLSFLALGAIFLVVTGSEALYADMGHFGKGPIRLGWVAFALPALVLNYFGQGALLITESTAIENPFYRLAPSWAVVPLVVLATMAAVIASQALISGAFSLTMQAIQLGYLPRQRIDHTSSREFGQIYIGTVNWALMVATLALVFAFRSSGALAGAYGMAVTTTMVITTLLLFVVMRERWHWPMGLALSLSSLFLVVDLGFFGANVLKIPDGGWVPLIVGLVVFALMVTWKRGRELVAGKMRRGQLSIERFIGSIVEHPQQRVPGTGVYMFPVAGVTPPALLANLKHQEVLHETIVLVAVKITNSPTVQQARRAVLHSFGEGFHQVDLRFGFMEDPNVPAALQNIVSKNFGFDETDSTFFLGRETVIPTEGAGMHIWRERIFAMMQRNATSAVQYFGLPSDRVFEVGVQVEI